MAIVEYGIGITALRGKVQGTVFQTGKYESVIKGKSSGQGQRLRPNLNAQSAFSHATTLFNQLSAPSVANWVAAIPDFPTEDRFGNPVLSSARDLFMRTIARKSISQQTALTTPRTVYSGAALVDAVLELHGNVLLYTPRPAPFGRI